MKKIIITIFFLFFLTSCFGSESAEVKKAKEEIFSSGDVIVEQTQSGSETSSGTSEVLDYNKAFYKVEKLIDNNYLDIEPINNVENITNEVEVNGIVNNPSIDKINVIFTNSISTFPKDDHTLTQFKKGDLSFLYRAFKSYKVLDNGTNEYQIDGYSGSELVSSIKLILNLPVKDNLSTSSGGVTSSGTSSQSGETSSGNINANLGDENNNLFLSLPVDESTYGKPTVNGNTSFTYSNLPDLNVKTDSNVFNITCENVKDYLGDNYTWYYWNTCRPFGNSNGLYVNVLTLSGEEYLYQRLYFDKYHGLMGTLNLETGTGVLKDDLSSKNDELKTKTFDILTKSDKLFNDLLKGN